MDSFWFFLEEGSTFFYCYFAGLGGLCYGDFTGFGLGILAMFATLSSHVCTSIGFLVVVGGGGVVDVVYFLNFRFKMLVRGSWECGGSNGFF